jgi:hypothetical protein
LVAVLLAFSVAQLFLPRETRTWRVPAIFGVIAAMVIGWDLGIATATWAYIKPILDSLFGQKGILPNSQKKGVAGSLPRIDTVWEYISTLLLVVLTPFGAWQAWKARRGKSNAVTLALV